VIAKRAQEIEPFLAVEVFQRAQAMEREGIDVVHLMFGEPDFETPPVIREAAEKALKDGRTRYKPTRWVSCRSGGHRRPLSCSLRRHRLAGSDPRDGGHVALDAVAVHYAVSIVATRSSSRIPITRAIRNS
jgi:hypothetical protein